VLATTADDLAARAVVLAANGGGLVLTAPGADPVSLGPCPNPALANERLAAVRRFASALIQSAYPGEHACGAPGLPGNRMAATAPADGGFPLDSDLHQMSDDGGPVGPDPARWTDPIWRDNPEGHDPDGGDTPEGRPAADQRAVPNVTR
jgi:hypothetical protein